MRRTRNTGVVYTGKVGARMTQPKHKAKTKRPTSFLAHRLAGGPFDGRIYSYELGSDLKTLTFRCRGVVGCYYGANWRPA